MNNFFSVDGVFYHICDTTARLLAVNLLLIVTSLPLITFGAALTAAHHVCGKIVEGRSGNVFQEFFSAFRKNWKASSILWSCCGGLLALLVIDLGYLITVKELLSWPIIGLGLVFILVAVVLQFGFPLIARYQTPVRQAVILAIKLCLAHPFISLLLLALTVGPLVACLLSPYLFVFGLYIGLFIAFAFMIFLQQHLLLYVFRKHEV